MITPDELQQVKLRFGIIGNAAGLNNALDIAIQVAPTDLTVLVFGESGVGKEHFPQIIHQYSSRKHGPYFAVNCGAIPEGTIDSELFGHEKGAFTGAVNERKGYFAEANGGTIFLDEIGEMPLPTQARLLRVLESGEYIRVGSSKVEKTNVRVVCATNVNLDDAIADGRFRADLYYRLGTLPIKVPPLRERGNDVILLFRKFASDFASNNRMPAIQLDESAKEMLLKHAWPGNVRELKNIVGQISVVETNRSITAEILNKYLKNVPQMHLPAIVGSSQGKSFESEREILYQVLFDMRRDITELKNQVNSLTQKQASTSMTQFPAQDISFVSDHSSSPIHISAPKAKVVDAEVIPVPDEYIEEPLSWNDTQREIIRKALERRHGKRKEAAKDLNISERTLYRKIKEYGLD